MKSARRNSKFFTLSALAITQLLLLAGCKSGMEANHNLSILVDKLPRQKNWQAEAEKNPIIKAGDFIDKGLWNDPHVLKEGDKYIMYFTTSTADNPFKPPILPYRAVSNDGFNWKLDPKKALLDASGTPFVSVETPSVVRFNGLYHMFYTGVYPDGAPAHFAIGHAVSKDGIRWEKDPKEALKPTGNATDWNGFIVGEPGAVVFNNSIYLYFSAVGQVPGATPPMEQSIGYVTTSDGKTFSEPKIALQLSPAYPKANNFCGYSTPAAVVDNGKIHLFYDIVVYNDNLEPSWQQVALGHAVSEDGGVSFWQDKEVIFTRNDFDWTGGEIRSPSALFENGRLRLWFAGMVPVSDFRPLIVRGIKGREFGIGHATIDANQLNSGR